MSGALSRRASVAEPDASTGAQLHPALALITAAFALAACFLAPSPQTRISVLAGTLLAFAALEFHRSRNILSPMILVAGLFGWLYVAKPLYVLDLGSFSAGAAPDAIVVAGAWEAVLAQAVGAATVTVCLVFVVFQVVLAHRHPAVRAHPRSLDKGRFQLVATAVMVLDVLAFGILVRAAGGLGAYVSGLALRSESLAGLSFLTLATVPLNLVLLIGLTARLRGDPGAPSKARLVALVVLAVSSAFLTGGRASLLTGLGLPLLVVVHYSYRRIGPMLGAVVGSVGLLAFISLGAFLRDAQFTRVSGRGPWDAVVARFSNLHESLVGGVEAVPFDSLVRVLGARHLQDMAWQGGATYRSIATWPIPRALWSEKPAGGGNTWFTETYVPRFYGDAKVESSISFIGESFANFGWWGVVWGSILVGVLIGVLHARLSPAGDAFGLPLYAALLGFLLPAFRGDAYHNVTSVVLVIGVWFGLRTVLGRIPETPSRRIRSQAYAGRGVRPRGRPARVGHVPSGRPAPADDLAEDLAQDALVGRA